MNAFRDWYIRNQDAITWFVIGLLTSAFVEHLVKGQYIWALVDAVLIYINYRFSKIRLQ